MARAPHVEMNWAPHQFYIFLIPVPVIIDRRAVQMNSAPQHWINAVPH